MFLCLKKIPLICYYVFNLLSGGFAGFSEGNLVDVEVGFGLMEFGKDALADGASIGGRAFCDEDDNLTELLIGTFADDKRCSHVRPQLTLEFLSLDFQTS